MVRGRVTCLVFGVTSHYTCNILCKIVSGNFSGPKAQELVVSRGKILELLRPDDQGKVQTIVSTEVFGIIRSLTPFRLPGMNTLFIFFHEGWVFQVDCCTK